MGTDAFLGRSTARECSSSMARSGRGAFGGTQCVCVEDEVVIRRIRAVYTMQYGHIPLVVSCPSG